MIGPTAGFDLYPLFRIFWQGLLKWNSGLCQCCEVLLKEKVSGTIYLPTGRIWNGPRATEYLDQRGFCHFQCLVAQFVIISARLIQKLRLAFQINKSWQVISLYSSAKIWRSAASFLKVVRDTKCIYQWSDLAHILPAIFIHWTVTVTVWCFYSIRLLKWISTDHFLV